MPGSLSNSDREYLTKMTPNLAQSADGRKMLIGAQVAVFQRQADVAKLARQWQQRFGRIDAPDANGKLFEDQLTRWSDAHPIFGKK
jgi:hypothetical protein